MENVRFGYFQVKTNEGIGIVCVALQRPEKGSSSKTVRAALSFYSPHESESFNKVRARAMASGRLLKWRERVEPHAIEPRVEFTYNSDMGKLQDIFNTALFLTSKNGQVPGWVSRGIKRNQVFCGLNNHFGKHGETPKHAVFQA